MSAIKIRKYKPEDHKDVNRIFGENIVDFQHVKDGILLGSTSTPPGSARTHARMT